jgi:glycosyltransferase involved in cell wall biosynthesis
MGNGMFFSRESGLLCKAFQEIGVECKAILPGPPREDDQVEDLIRTDYENLENSAWWASLGGDGVVFYGWGSPNYTNIVRAIKKSGMLVVTSIDASGLVSPYVAFREYTRILYGLKCAHAGRLLGSLAASASLCRSLVPALFDKKRLQHLMLADRVTMVTPEAVEIMKALAVRFGYAGVAEKTSYLPHPQLPFFAFEGAPKENLIITVGRWGKSDWFQKHPQLLIKSISRFLEARPDYRYQVIGNSVENLRPLIDRYCRRMEDRIELTPFLKPADLRETYSKARIAFWASRHEGQQGTGAQALCCGCSVVSTGGLSMNCFAHYASRSSGRQALRNNARSLADALVMEATAWDEGDRDPHNISTAWVPEFCASNIARRILKLAGRPLP